MLVINPWSCLCTPPISTQTQGYFCKHYGFRSRQIQLNDVSLRNKQQNNDDGNRRYSTRVLPQPDRQHKPDLAVVEACGPSGWVSDLCREHGVEIIACGTNEDAWLFKNVKRKTAYLRLSQSNQGYRHNGLDAYPTFLVLLFRLFNGQCKLERCTFAKFAFNRQLALVNLSDALTNCQA